MGWVLLLVSLSGATALAYELAWFRVLAVSLGATAPALAAVLASFMGGLALGSRLGGRWVDRRGRGLLVYGVLELGIGAWALSFLPLVGALEAAYGAAYGSVAPETLHLLRFVVAALVLLPPTVAMGATLPAVVAGVSGAAPDPGRSKGHPGEARARPEALNRASALQAAGGAGVASRGFRSKLMAKSRSPT